MTARKELVTLFRALVADDDPDLKLIFWWHVVTGPSRCEHRLSRRARRATAPIFAATLVSCPQLFPRIVVAHFTGIVPLQSPCKTENNDAPSVVAEGAAT